MLFKTTQESTRRTAPRLAAAAGAIALLAASLPAAGQSSGQTGTMGGQDAAGSSGKQQAAVTRVAEAVRVVHTMSAAPGMPALLKQARGIYIVPTYARAALGVGASGGVGVLMVRRADGSWGNPAFFNTGGLSIGVQAGAEGGSLALLLMNQKAIDHFRKKNNFSLNADAGLTVVNFARMKRGSTAGDVVAWSGTKGLFGNAVAVDVNDVRYNQDVTQAYYGKPVTAVQAIDSTEIDAQADALRQVLDKPPSPAGSATGGK